MTNHGLEIIHSKQKREPQGNFLTALQKVRAISELYADITSQAVKLLQITTCKKNYAMQSMPHSVLTCRRNQSKDSECAN